MDAGVGGYLSYMLTRKSAYQDEILAWHKAQLDIAREAVNSGKWVKIQDISYLYDWNLAEAASPGLASAESYVIVNFLVETYGLDKCVATFQAVSHNGGSAESALSSVLGTTFEQLETGVKSWIMSH